MLTQTWFDCVDDGVGEEKSDIASHITTHTYTPQLCLKCQEHTHTHTKHSVISGKKWFIFSLCLKTWCFQKWRLTSAYSLIGMHIHVYTATVHTIKTKPYWKNVDIKSRCVQWSITTFKRPNSTKSCEHSSNALRSINEQSIGLQFCQCPLSGSVSHRVSLSLTTCFSVALLYAYVLDQKRLQSFDHKTKQSNI